MRQKQRDTTRITTTFGWTGSTDPTDVPYQGDEAQKQTNSQESIEVFYKIYEKDLKILDQIFMKAFIKTSEVDQVLECEMHQTEYKVMIGCDMDWPP